jgi:diguanylate cyclase (GGDEF)-like protein
VSRFGQLSGFFAPRDDPYAGGDLANAQRLCAVLFGLIFVLTVALLPGSPPEEPSPAAGWVITVVMLATGGWLIYMTRAQRIPSWYWLLAAGYLIVAGLGVEQLITGGVEEPYSSLLLLPVVFVAATQPPRQIAVFMVAVFIVLMAPLLYDRWDSEEAGAAAATFVIWCALALGGNMLMSGVRAQRLSHEAEEAEARHEARIDSLTGLHNRRAFDEMLSSEVKRARRLQLPLTIAMVDIENFKEVNDRWSYAEGDRCLREVAAALGRSLREPDFCFRWGGDEFALILSGTAADDTATIAERLRGEVEANCRRPDDSPVHIRFAVAELREGMETDELTEMVGLALTAEKLNGT